MLRAFPHRQSCITILPKAKVCVVKAHGATYYPPEFYLQFKLEEHFPLGDLQNGLRREEEKALRELHGQHGDLHILLRDRFWREESNSRNFYLTVAAIWIPRPDPNGLLLM